MKYKVFKKSVVVERFPKKKCDIHTYIHTYIHAGYCVHKLFS